MKQSAKKETNYIRPLTNAEIDRYTRLDEHSRNVLRNFAKHFPESTIVWMRPTGRKEEPQTH